MNASVCSVGQLLTAGCSARLLPLPLLLPERLRTVNQWHWSLHDSGVTFGTDESDEWIGQLRRFEATVKANTKTEGKRLLLKVERLSTLEEEHVPLEKIEKMISLSQNK